MQTTSFVSDRELGDEPPDGEVNSSASLAELRARILALETNLRDFIRRRPTAALLGALGLGYVVARLARRWR
jgi:hypothetical protein